MATSLHPSQIDVRKFQFDEFDGDDEGGALEALGVAAIPEATYSQAQMDAAINAAQEAGYAKGQQAADATIEADIQRLMARIAEAAESAIADQKALQATIGFESVRLAGLIARKVLPAMAEAGALTEIETLIQRCLSDRPEESRLVIRVHDGMLDKIETRLAKVVADTGFAGKPILLADPSLRQSEVRIEWANGGVDWSFARQIADIESACNALAPKSKVKAYDTPTDPHDDSPMSEIMDAEIIEDAAPPTDQSGE